MKKDIPLSENELVKEVCRQIRVVRSCWNARNNAACLHERDHLLCPVTFSKAVEVCSLASMIICST